MESVVPIPAVVKFSRQVGAVHLKAGVAVMVTCPSKAVFAIISYNNGDITVRVPAKDLRLFLERTEEKPKGKKKVA